MPNIASFSLSKRGKTTIFNFQAGNEWELVFREPVQPGEELQLSGPPELFQTELGAILQGPRFVLVSNNKKDRTLNNHGSRQTQNKVDKLNSLLDDSFSVTLGQDGIARDKLGHTHASLIRGLIPEDRALKTIKQNYVSGEAQLRFKPPLELTHAVEASIYGEELFIAPGDILEVQLKTTPKSNSANIPLYSKVFSSHLQCATICMLGSVNIPVVPNFVDNGELTAYFKFHNSGTGQSHIKSMQVSLKAQPILQKQEDPIEILNFENVPATSQSLGVIESFPALLQEQLYLRHGEVERTIQGLESKELMVIGPVLSPQAVSQPGFVRYSFKLPESMGDLALKVLVRTAGRTYQKGDYMGVRVLMSLSFFL